MKQYALNRYYIFDNNSVACLLLSMHEDEKEAKALCDEFEKAITDLGSCTMVRMEGNRGARSTGLTAGAHLRALGIKRITHDVMGVDLYSPIRKPESRIIVPQH